MKIAFLGYGQVGAPLADHLQRLGHQVYLAAKDAESASVLKALERNPHLQVAEPNSAVGQAEIIFLATPYAANETVLASVSTELAGKVLIDCTNPVGAQLSHGLNSQQSGTQVIQNQLPATAVVKAFSIYGFENFEDNQFPNASLKPAMLFCGNSQSAKQQVAHLIAELGWDPVDAGGLEQALHLEHMTLLWIRLVRLQGRSAHLTWARLER